MKRIIQRHLPLDVRYICTDKKYIPLIEGSGCTCDNCGQLLANIATVKSVNGVYSIGFDCLETVLLNNNLLDGFNIDEFERTKKMIPQVIGFSKKIKEVIKNSPQVTGIRFETPDFADWFTFYWLSDSRPYNDCIKIKGMDFNFLVETLKNIFPKLEIITL